MDSENGQKAFLLHFHWILLHTDLFAIKMNIFLGIIKNLSLLSTIKLAQQILIEMPIHDEF